MVKKNILPTDIIVIPDSCNNPEEIQLKDPNCNADIKDIDELIFPEEYFYISQR